MHQSTQKLVKKQMKMPSYLLHYDNLAGTIPSQEFSFSPIHSNGWIKIKQMQSLCKMTFRVSVFIVENEEGQRYPSSKQDAETGSMQEEGKQKNSPAVVFVT